MYAGGNAHMVEKVFGFSGSQLLYVGDHIFTDVNLAKRGLSWRTCLILQVHMPDGSYMPHLTDSSTYCARACLILPGNSLEKPVQRV